MSTSELLTARYGELDVQLAATARDGFNDVLSLLLEHRSVRQFVAQRLPDLTLERLIAVAQSAANTSNLQTWSVVAIEDTERKNRISKLVGNQAHVRDAPLFLAWVVDLSRLQRLGVEQNKPTEGLAYLDVFLAAAIDAALAAQNVVTAAESLGLGTVYIGGLRNQPEAVAEELNLGEGVFPIFGLCIGRPNTDKPAAIKPRLPQQAILYREQYVRRPVEEELGQYDAIMQAFYQKQAMPPGTWSAQSIERVRNADSLKGRDRLAQALDGLGFPLR
ncbi:MAG: NADPH-dependent oxidoreductase [Oxalicibacterium faecigallinarum]|uniref:NADPH-dependent oxidoreductase n=1 Tax=Oxalicibacterium faecigallinarum TaxID=573741 RepID=UPI0028081845|nr:NADPH-dependent oxidoreductase [Oxalicibacterium faecigallinarum]MDQ7969518.1 NADPH-dependent oxidoreductase [Oxalicibacterium faecigallinarum]